MFPQTNQTQSQSSIQSSLTKISNSLIFSTSQITPSRYSYFQKCILIYLPQIIHTIIKSHIIFLKEQLSNHKSVIDQLDIQAILDSNESTTILEQFIRELQKIQNIYQNEQQNKIGILVDMLDFKKNVSNNIIPIYKHINNSNINVQKLQQSLNEQIQIKIQQILIKISQIINWLLSYTCIKNIISSQQYQKIIKILIEQTLNIGNKIKNDQLHNYYLTKLLKNKNYMNWNQQFIHQWLNYKKQILKIEKENIGNNYCYLENKIGCVIRKSIQWFKIQEATQKKQQNFDQIPENQLSRSINEQNDRKNQINLSFSYDHHSSFEKQRSIHDINPDLNLSKQNKNNKEIFASQPQPKFKQLSSIQYQQQRKQAQQNNHALPKLVPSISINSQNSEQNKLLLTKQQKDKKINQYFPKRLNLLNHIQKNFIFQKSHGDTIVLVVKQISNGQKYFMKTIIKQLIKRARFNNIRYDNQMYGDQFKYYNIHNTKINEQFSSKINNIDKIIKNTKLNQHRRNTDERIYYKLTYPSKLQQYFQLKYSEQQQQQRMLQQLKKINQVQRSSKSEEYYGKKIPQQIVKYICEDWTKDKTEKFRQNQIIKTKRLKISVNMIKDVLLEKCDWIFAAEKAFYRW